MERTRAKFKVVGKTEGTDGTGNVSLQAVHAGSEENEAFFRYTPAGSINLNILNPQAMAAFEQGAEYYVDFTKAE
ncbi:MULTISPECIES: hypothetical protein [Deinococcus]|uniref:Uncharacterized protein n=1 Tax=Deinococcus rufus TaxID=2136097 RepID=A0ABV7ZF93_9DEIO|nr:hypothetical protein [Deinococcus sp. AB2017081]WQE94055.1 hypothetical protein U2P90_11610 [Deinococcus sp. AB2017081]